jgi:hypothetical protein
VISANEEDLKLAYKELSCFLEGERSNVHWVDISADTLVEKNILMSEKMHNLRLSSHYKWIVTIRKALPKVFNMFNKACKQVSGGGEDEYGVPIPMVDCYSEEFQDLFKELGVKMDALNSSLTLEHNLKDTLESVTITDTFNDMRTYIDSCWKENIITMNDILSSEVLLFLKRNAEFKEYLSDYNMMNEIEMYIFEQASSHRLDRFWTETYEKNNVFSSELKYTLNKIIHTVEKEHSMIKDKNAISKVGKGIPNEQDTLNISSRMKIELGSSEVRSSPLKPDMKGKDAAAGGGDDFV